MSNNRYLWKRVKGKKMTMHRLLMQEKLGRPLEANEHVYHVNGDPKDNSLENLVIIVKKAR